MYQRLLTSITLSIAVLTFALSTRADVVDAIILRNNTYAPIEDASVAPSYSLGSGLNASSFLTPLESHVGGLQFNFTPTGNLADMLAGNQGGAQQTLGQNVLDSFDDAGHLWSDIFEDDITINVTIDFDDLGSGVLGSTGNATAQSNYSSTRTALTNDATSADDSTAVANMQPGSGLDIRTVNTGNPAYNIVRDDNGSANNTQLDVSRANLKALGIISGTNTSTDGSITFSDQFSWDFDQTPSGSQIDLIGVAAHEIGHLMGFTSGVDVVDFVGEDGPAGPQNLNNFRVFSVLDLYRVSADSLAYGSQPSPGVVLDLAYGGSPYFSIDGGTTNLGGFATGNYNGDGDQASHWKDNQSLGIMDPTFSFGSIGVISPLDIQAFDVIGYDLAPITVDPSNASFNLISDIDILNIDFGTASVGDSISPNIFSVFNLFGSGNMVDLDLVTITPSGDSGTLTTNLAPFINLAEGGLFNYNSFLDTSVAGNFNASYDLSFTDELGTNQSLTLNLSGIVEEILDPSNASFDDPADLDILNLDFGTLAQHAAATPLSFDLTNLLDGPGTVNLDLISITPSGDFGSLTTDLALFIDLAASGSLNFDSFFDTGVAGSFSASYELGFTDELGTNQTLTLNLSGAVSCLAGDADCDGDIDLDDVIVAVGSFTGPCTDGVDCLGDPLNGGSVFDKIRTDGDVNDLGTDLFGVLPLIGDGDVDLDDIILMVGAFTGPLDTVGSFDAPATSLGLGLQSSAVPEPSTFVLASLGLLALGLFDRRRRCRKLLA